MKTLDDYVRDGVVLEQGPTVNGEYTREMYVGDDRYVGIDSDGFMFADDGHYTPTQLRALSAMALWAAEQVEKKQ